MKPGEFFQALGRKAAELWLLLFVARSRCLVLGVGGCLFPFVLRLQLNTQLELKLPVVPLGAGQCAGEAYGQEVEERQP